MANLQRVKSVYAMTHDGFVVPCQLHLGIQTESEQGISYVGLLRRKENQRVILVNSEGEIEGFTRELAEDLGLENTPLEGRNMLRRLCPELENVIIAFTNSQNEKIGRKRPKIKRHVSETLYILDFPTDQSPSVIARGLIEKYSAGAVLEFLLLNECEELEKSIYYNAIVEVQMHLDDFITVIKLERLLSDNGSCKSTDIDEFQDIGEPPPRQDSLASLCLIKDPLAELDYPVYQTAKTKNTYKFDQIENQKLDCNLYKSESKNSKKKGVSFLEADSSLANRPLWSFQKIDMIVDDEEKVISSKCKKITIKDPPLSRSANETKPQTTTLQTSENARQAARMLLKNYKKLHTNSTMLNKLENIKKQADIDIMIHASQEGSSLTGKSRINSWEKKAS